MWLVFILCAIISGVMVSNVEEFYRNYTQILELQDAKKERDSVLRGTCWRSTPDPKDQLKGCTSDIPLIDDGKIVAARIYQSPGNDIQALSCNGGCHTFYAETRSTSSNGALAFFSVIINPGCTIYIFPENYYGGTPTPYNGPAILTNPELPEGFPYCGVGRPCVGSFLFTCKQVLPSCTPTDGWQVVTSLDNTDSTIPSKFTYTETLGTIFSQSMTNSMGVSATLSEEIGASFFDLFSAKIGVSLTTKYDWSKTDSETKSKSISYSVEVNIPGGVKVHIEEAVGTCGGSTVHTQMFRVRDDKTNQIVRVHQGKMTKYKLGKKDFQM